MRKVSVLLLAAAACFGQTPAAPDKASPEVDAALRERINQFYQLEVAGKFSQAYPLVADDTKDLFIGSSKPTYTGFEIQNIKYYDDFTKAEVSMMVTRLLPIQGFMGHPLPSKMLSRWKIENGLWCFFVDPQKDLPTSPFGGMPIPGAGRPAVMPGAMPGVVPGGAPGAAPQPPPLPKHLADARMLTADKPNVQLKAKGAASEQVTIPNTSPWQLTLAVTDPKVPGLTVELSPLRLAPRQKAALVIKTAAGVEMPKRPVTITVTVQETKQTIPIKLLFVD
ncbi:MAG: hypothetical protein ACLP59_07295 [Bryobacteraceae bacterium]